MTRIVLSMAGLAMVAACRGRNGAAPEEGTPHAVDVGTRGQSTPSAVPSAADQAVPAEPTAALAPAVAFDCSGLPVRERASACEPPPEWAIELHTLGDAFMEPRHEGATHDECARAERALGAALLAGREALPLRSRIVAQNAAFRIFARAGSCGDRATNLFRSSARVVGALRPDASEVRALGDAPMSEIEGFIGSPNAWQERRSPNLPLFHELVEYKSRAFRPVSTPEVRAIWSQLVAVDADWKPHVTPLVGRIELRRGHSDDARACVAKLDVERIECTSGRLAVLTSLDHLPVSHFIRQVEPGHVGCLDCHGPRGRSAGDPVFGDLGEIGTEEGRSEHLRARREALLAGAAELVASMKKTLAEEKAAK